MSAILKYRSLGNLLTITACVLCVIQLFPDLMFSHDLVRSNRLLFFAFYNNDVEPELLPHSQNDDSVKGAVSFLKDALGWNQHSLLLYRLLIKGYISHNDWPLALDTAERAVEELPASLIKNSEEIIVPYFYKIGQKDRCDEVTTENINLVSWFVVNKDQLITLANKLLLQGQPIIARGIYCVADRQFGTDRISGQQFRNTVLAIMAKAPSAPLSLQALKGGEQSLVISNVNASPVSISISSMRWMTSISRYNVTFGVPFVKADTPVGTFWWDGQATAIINIKQSGVYTIETELRSSQPTPVHMAVGIDGKHSSHFSLEDNDNSWKKVYISETLETGLHTIDIWFLNNTVANGQDRNGAVKAVKIYPNVN